jgi:hypothetical protein
VGRPGCSFSEKIEEECCWRRLRDKVAENEKKIEQKAGGFLLDFLQRLTRFFAI